MKDPKRIIIRRQRRNKTLKIMKEITQKEINILNKMIKRGQIEITSSHVVWGPRAFKTKNDHLKVTHKQGRFYGGGISENYYTFLINNKKQFTTKNMLIAQKAFFDNLRQYNIS